MVAVYALADKVSAGVAKAVQSRIMKPITARFSAAERQPIIPRDLYGHFAEHLGGCIYGGLWVGEDSSIPNTRGIRNDVADALRELKIPVLRWPGGCFADEYHWMDGIGPRARRPRHYNSHWGGVVENNHFGTHEFFDLCGQLGCEAYVAGNVGSGTVQEMSQWVEYMTSPAESHMAELRRENGQEEPWRVRYFGVGNENWGCGGHMRPEYYADLYRRYNTYVRTYGPDRIMRVACGPNTADYRWTEVMMAQAQGHMDALALHYYTLLNASWPPTGHAASFDDEGLRSTLSSALKMDGLIARHSEIMDRTDPEKKVNLAVDEWGTWHAVEPGTNPGFLYQQNTMRDALVASCTFDIFHRRCERVRLANIAQMVNVLQAMVLTDGPRMAVTPTYHAFRMYAAHQDAERRGFFIGADLLAEDLPSASGTASEKDGVITISLSCLDPHEGRTVAIQGLPADSAWAGGEALTAPQMSAVNSFDSPDAVRPHAIDGRLVSGELEVELPPLSVATISLRRA
jgi:alpha-N-arabinofuranosidase